MKNIILIVLISISLNCFGQDPVLFDNYWILEDLILDNVSHLPPNNDEVTNVTLEFDSYENNGLEYINLFSNVCETIGGLIDFNDIDNTFSFYDGPYETLGGECVQSQNATYEGIYFGFFYDNHNNGNIFDYSIVTNNDNSKTLTINSFNGDQAIYGSQTLSIIENEVFEISISYDTKTNSIKIASEKKLESVSIKIFNTLGRLILNLNENNKEKMNIDARQFTDGIYFVILQNNIGQIMRKRILKY